MAPEPLKQRALALIAKVDTLRRQLAAQVIGQDALIDELLVAILAGGHVLLEGLPGLGKTLLVRSLAAGLGLQSSRIQFTPDLMPADVTGTLVVDERGGERSFRFQRGPIFAGIVLADEINRATPKTQSALLEAMQEAAVTVAGESHRLPEPFHVIATQNPIELEGTYPLPEAQLDRFLFKLEVRMPSVDAVVRILDDTTGASGHSATPLLQSDELLELQRLVRGVLCGSHLLRYVAQLVACTHPEDAASSESTKKLVRYGASVRGGQAIVLGAKARALLDGRAAIDRDDVDHCMVPALRHRVLLGYEADASGTDVASLLRGWRADAERALR